MDINRLAGQVPTNDKQKAADQSDIGRDAFLKLLVAQMRNQDPLEPMDSREFVTQLSELTGVDRLGQINDGVEMLERAVMSVSNTQAASLAGRTVTADASTLRLNALGPAHAVYNLADRADAVQVSIRDTQGNVVHTMNVGAQPPGARTVQWDGNDATGRRAPPGRYRIEISARTEQGQPVAATTQITGRVTAISYDNGFPELAVGDAKILLGDVVSIGE